MGTKHENQDSSSHHIANITGGDLNDARASTRDVLHVFAIVSRKPLWIYALEAGTETLQSRLHSLQPSMSSLLNQRTCHNVSILLSRTLSTV